MKELGGCLMFILAAVFLISLAVLLCSAIAYLALWGIDVWQAGHHIKGALMVGVALFVTMYVRNYDVNRLK